MTPLTDSAPPPRTLRRRRVTLVAVLGFVAVVAAMWVYALFFASRRSPDKVPDRAWAASAQTICLDARARIDALPAAETFRKVEPRVEALRQRAVVLDQANDALATQLASLRALVPADATTTKLAGEWLADWDTYLADRRVHSDELKAGKNVAFKESTYSESPISNRMNAFARVNRMPRCGTPYDVA